MSIDGNDNLGGPGALVDPLIARVVATAIYLHNGDDLRRFHDLGEGPRDIHHYRELTGKPRGHGVLVTYPYGTILHLEAAPSPTGPDDELWLVVLDTSIGLPWTGWRRLQRQGLVKLEMPSDECSREGNSVIVAR